MEISCDNSDVQVIVADYTMKLGRINMGKTNDCHLKVRANIINNVDNAVH
jgi:hypothetical protein